MPDTSGTFSITVPCENETITLAGLQEFSADIEAAIAAVNVVGTRARVRPALALAWATPGTPYVAGTPVLMNFGNPGFDNDSMFNPATPTIATVKTAGTWLIVGRPVANMTITNTSFKGEVLVNGTAVAAAKTGSALAGNQPPNPLSLPVMVPNMIVGDQISLRITVTGVGNDSAFSFLFACLVSYGV
jgi:hypothetical protein